jgi:methylase of polypeptide subunit release factors
MPDRNLGDQERRHWRRTFTAHPDMYGTQPSEPAQHAIDQFTWEHCHATLELGAGQRRDTLAFLAAGFDVTALDYEADALRLLEDTAGRLGVTDRLGVVGHDVRDPLPWSDATFDAVYSHMLFNWR